MFFSRTLIAVSALTAFSSTVLAFGSHVELHSIRARQLLEKRTNRAHDAFQKLNTDLAPVLHDIKKNCAKVTTAKKSERIQIGLNIHAGITQCQQIVSMCSPVPPIPAPQHSTKPGDGPTTPPTCKAIALEFGLTVSSIIELSLELKSALANIPELEASIKAAYAELDAELTLLLEGTQNGVPCICASVRANIYKWGFLKLGAKLSVFNLLKLRAFLALG